MSKLYNTTIRTIYETLLWGIIILGKEKITFDYGSNKSKITEHYDKTIAIYQTESDHYYGNIVNRYSDTASFLKELTGFDFKNYLLSSTFRSQIKPMLQTDHDVDITLGKDQCKKSFVYHREYPSRYQASSNICICEERWCSRSSRWSAAIVVDIGISGEAL